MWNCTTSTEYMRLYVLKGYSPYVYSYVQHYTIYFPMYCTQKEKVHDAVCKTAAGHWPFSDHLSSIMEPLTGHKTHCQWNSWWTLINPVQTLYYWRSYQKRSDFTGYVRYANTACTFSWADSCTLVTFASASASLPCSWTFWWSASKLSLASCVCVCLHT